MAMDGLPEGGSPSGRVPEQLLQQLRSEKRRRRRNRRVSAKKSSRFGVSTPRAIYRRRGASGGHLGQPGGFPAPSPLLGRVRDPSGSLAVAPALSFGFSGVFRSADF